MEQNAAPVINPADLAAIIAKAKGNGFAPNAATRRVVSANAQSDFLPAHFGTTARSHTPHPPQGQNDTLRPFDSPPAPRPEPIAPPPRDIEAEIAQARAEGYQDGLAKGIVQGKAEAEAHLRAVQQDDMLVARDLFVKAAAELSSPATLIAGDLTQALERAVLRLASARAGMAIDANPKPFSTRLARLADRVSQGMRPVTVSVHPDDLAALLPHLEGHLAEGVTLAALPTLMRGDLVAKCPGIQVADLLGDAQGDDE